MENLLNTITTKEDFTGRFLRYDAAKVLYPDDVVRATVADAVWDNRDLFRNSKANVWPKLYSAKFIEPGLVHYEEYGMVLVQKPVLDKMLPSFVGRPVVNVVHKNINPSRFRDEADGVISRVWYNEADGWYWSDFIVWDEATQRNCESPAYSVSCAYVVSDENEKAGEYHSIPYQREVLDGEYTHMAVVANPRYEGARIVYNSKGGSMKLFNWFKKGEAAKTPADVEKAIVEIDGKKVSVKELIDVHNAREAAGKKADEPTLENMSDDTIIEIDGKEMPLKNLKDSYRKNAEDEADKKKAEDLKNAEDEEEKKKKDMEAKNAADAKAKTDAEAEKVRLENERKAKEGTDHFNAIKTAAEVRGKPQEANLVTRRELAAVGAEKYGTKK